MAFHTGQLVIVRGIRGRRMAKGTVTYSDRYGAIVEVEGHGSLYVQRRRIDPSHCISFGMYHVEPITRETLDRFGLAIRNHLNRR
jgi:hypothetical protein